MLTAVHVDCKLVKARQKTTTAEDLLFAGASDGSHLAAAAVSPVVMSARGPTVVDSALRTAAVVEPGCSPPERDYSTRTATCRAKRWYLPVSCKFILF